MRSTIFLGAAAALALIATDPAFCGQATTPPPPADPMPAPSPGDPDQPIPAPVPDPAQPPLPGQPIPPEMQTPPAPAPGQQPVRVNTDAPIGPMATPPGGDSAVSGGTTSQRLQPVPATKEYPPCTRTLQDNCRNPGEGPRASRRPR
jgi:hypothetical protein